MTPEIQALHDTYVPRVISRADWEAVADSARAWLLLASPTERQLALQLMLLFGRLALWAKSLSLPTKPNVLFTPAMVDRFIEHIDATLGKKTAAEYRAVLRRVGPVVGDKNEWDKPGKQLGRNSVPRPLDADTERACITQARRAGISHLGMCLLGFGCGLDGRWLPHVRGVDVIDIDGWTHVQVADPDARAIPVLARYADELVEVAETIGDGFIIGGENHVQNRVWALTRKVLIDQGRKLFVGEMRSTWFAHHLANNTHLIYLSHITGVKSFTRLLDVLEFVEVSDEASMAAHARRA